MTPEKYPVPRVFLIVTIHLLALLFLAIPTLAVSPELIATAIDGQQTTGELVSWQADNLTLTSGGKTVELPLDRLLSIHPAASSTKPKQLPIYVELTDGSQLPLRDFAVSDHQATIDTPLAAEPLVLSTEQVQLVQFSPRARENAAFWSDLANKQLPGDVLVVQQSGAEQVEYLSGVLGDVSAEQINFKWDGEDIPVKRTKVVALAYYHGQALELPSASCWLTTVDGARLPVAQLEWDPSSKKLHVTTVGGIKLVVSLARLHEADYSIGKLTYLSDLEPLAQEWTPRIDLPASAELIREHGLPRRDQSFSGSSLSLSWPAEATEGPGVTKNYAKGLALRSRTVLEYRIPEGMNRLVAVAGIDPATAGQGNVTLEISADDQVLWQGEIDGGAAPIEINVPLPQARRLRLLVDYGGNLDYGDRLHLIDARMTK